ncbi:MAG TPA: PDZ domain-containing protein [Pyrinomonadaceae bacterium]|jgi:S1-C subfamily serine protease
MKYPDYIRAATSRARNSGGLLSLACLLLLCSAAAHGRQATAPRAPRPALAPRPASAQPAQAPIPPAPAARPAPPRRAPVPAAVVPPREVVTVVHRLSGWKLLAWLAASGPPALELDEWPSPSDAHTNIVAGYVYGDGRGVVARLPQSEVELEAFNAPPVPPSLFAPAGSQFKAEPEYTLVTAEGKRVEAKFVGLDSSTGLALLEAGEPLLAAAPTGDAGDTDDPEVGQRVRLYAPIPADAPAPAARAAAPQPPAPGYVYLSIDQKEGRLTRLVRAPSGQLSSVILSARVSPEWVGAVAANELGEVVGIVSQSRDGETRIMHLSAVREACARVLKLRGTAPQPWLGARGDAVAQAPLQFWVERGWTPEAARPLIAKRRGVFLTSVAPGTPAALAGLRAGDLIASVGPRDVRSNEDLSMTLKEAGVGSLVDLTVWRAMAPEPLKLTVELKGAKNPALATAQAEERALVASLLGSEREISEMRAAEARLRGGAAAPRAADLAGIAERIADAEGRARRLREQLELTRRRLGASNFFSFENAPVIGPQARRADDDLTRGLKAFGLHAIGLSRRGAGPLGAEGGLLVVAVQPESPAAASGLLVGDVIETVNGSPLWRFELRRMTSTPGATPAVLGLVRAGRRLSVSVTPPAAGERQR